MAVKTQLARAITLAFGATALSLSMSSTVLAQSNTTGNVYGAVESPAGATVVIENLDTKLRRTTAVENNGRFQATSLPPGRYAVQLVRDGKVIDTREVEVLIGQGAEAVFTTQRVQVVGRRRAIDVTNTNNGATFTASQLQKLPIARNVESIVLIAPNTTQGDNRYPGGANSFGGGAVSENSYYVNGFPVTNPLTQLGYMELPFGAIGQAQILTGGFGAEFGRSVGGVANITTKSGTNRWEAGGVVQWEPKKLAASQEDIRYPVVGGTNTAATDGTLYRQRSANETDRKLVGVSVGGPLIQDKLFMFGSLESSQTDFSGTNAINGLRTSTSAGIRGWEESETKTTRYLVKLDWNINDNHRLEYTGFGDTSKKDKFLSGYNYATLVRNGTIGASEHYKNFSGETPVGGIVNIAKYTGNLTDNLTLLALYGRSKTKHENTYGTYPGVNPNVYQVTSTVAARAPGVSYPNPNPISGNIPVTGGEDTVESARLDLEYKLGNHTIRAGIDENRLSSEDAGLFRAGGGLWAYGRSSQPATTPIPLQNVVVAPASGGGLGLQGYYVTETKFTSVTDAYSDQSAQYIEDRWQVTKDLLLTIGVRNEQFENRNGDNQKFMDIKDQIAPRFSAAWDVYGDASFKVFGSAGRYFVQVPTNISVRGASRSLFTSQAFTYTGVDPATGTPLGLVPLVPAPFSTNNEYFQVKHPQSVAATNLRPTYQDELTLGIERALTPDLTFGARATYRTLRSTIDDMCDNRPFLAWLARNPGVNTSKWTGFGCAAFNPGEDNTFLVDFANTGSNLTEVKLSAADLGFAEAKRTYKAIDLFLEHPLRNGWYGKVNYTWSKNYGNTEGQTQSDIGQLDVSHTVSWDKPELMRGKYGPLPNDRTHQLKAFGFYQVTPEWMVGGNLLAQSGRPKNCLGADPTVPAAHSYGSYYDTCFGRPAPRGSEGRLPWTTRLDLNVAYMPAFVPGLSAKLDVFNVANRQTTQSIQEQLNSGSTQTLLDSYHRVLSTQTPRYGRFTVEYNHKF
ncbi:TonB-dependent receptor [Massilia sp. SYSU DXS3249]